MGRTSSQVKDRWNREHYMQLSIRVPIKEGEAFKEKCKAKNISQAEIIKQAVSDFLREE